MSVVSQLLTATNAAPERGKLCLAAGRSERSERSPAVIVPLGVRPLKEANKCLYAGNGKVSA